MSPSSKTKSDLQDELEELRTKLEDAHSIIGEALGYDSTDDAESEERNEDDEDDEDDENDEN